MRTILLCTVAGVKVFQELETDRLRVYFKADLSDDADGSPRSYRMDDNQRLALDDIHRSAGYPDGEWHDVLAVDPINRNRPYVDAEGYCVSKTSYRHYDERHNPYPDIDRRSWVDATKVPYLVAPGKVRALCAGVLCGCAGRVTRTTDGKVIEGVTADFSGGNIGEASDALCKGFDSRLSPRNGDERQIYLYEFFPNTPAVVLGETYELQRYSH